VGCLHTTSIVIVCLESSQFHVDTDLDTHPKDAIIIAPPGTVELGID
jgi:hypothetical protein